MKLEPRLSYLIRVCVCKVEVVASLCNLVFLNFCGIGPAPYSKKRILSHLEHLMALNFEDDFWESMRITKRWAVFKSGSTMQRLQTQNLFTHTMQWRVMVSIQCYSHGQPACFPFANFLVRLRICTETFDATFQQRDDQNWQLQSKPLWL